MDLLTGKNKYIKKLSCLKPRQRIALTAIILTVTLSLWFFVVQANLQKAVSKNKSIVSQKIKRVNLLKSSKNTCKTLETKIKNIKRNINKNTQRKNLSNIAQYNINDMIAYAQSSGISLKSYSTLEEMVDKHLINKHKVSYEFTSDLDRALVFCNKLKRSKKTLECQELKISISDDNKCHLRCILEFSHLKPVA